MDNPTDNPKVCLACVGAPNALHICGTSVSCPCPALVEASQLIAGWLNAENEPRHAPPSLISRSMAFVSSYPNTGLPEGMVVVDKEYLEIASNWLERLSNHRIVAETIIYFRAALEKGP